MSTTSRNFQISLPEDIYRQLLFEAERIQQPAGMLAQQAIANWLQQRQKSSISENIQTYAEQHAGTAMDLDTDLEAASLEFLHDQEHGE
ncbi:MAG: hypothetical protein ETSY1_34505 [Candidatus Entotheonella factor]|uniref:Uncharacterized protein n=1 Tax=Entotheonella factor TaxID=1429438 RepID=W4L9D1_ENTF1|nr:hypothetical protein [Candidatus Entotheonella palauensis]ETW94514.1 MAG: hypothetical protein ETSY1_34505 [Candidatus Entotheonella factor]